MKLFAESKYSRIFVSAIKLITKTNDMKNSNEYARIEFNGSKTYMVIDSANHCLFATSSERKAKNFLSKVLKNAGY